MKQNVALISVTASPLTAVSSEQSAYVARTAENLAALGYDVDVFTRRDSPEQSEIVKWLDGVRVVHVPAGSPTMIDAAETLKIMPQFTSYLLRFAAQKSYDLIHANFYFSGLAALNVKRAAETPFVVTFHELGRADKLHYTGADDLSDARVEIEDRIVREAEFIFAESPQQTRDLMYLYDAPFEKIISESSENNLQTISETYEKTIRRRAAQTSFGGKSFLTREVTSPKFNSRAAR